MAEEHRQRDEGAAGVIDRDEGGVGDDVERLLAAIVGMRPPTDVGEQASGMAQPPFVHGLVEPEEAMNRSIRSAPRHGRATASAAR